MVFANKRSKHIPNYILAPTFDNGEAKAYAYVDDNETKDKLAELKEKYKDVEGTINVWCKDINDFSIA